MLVRVTQAEPPSPVRVDADDQPRLVAAVPSLDDLVRLAFDQVRGSAEPHVTVRRRLMALLEHLEQTAGAHGQPTAEIERQARMLSGGSPGA